MHTQLLKNFSCTVVSGGEPATEPITLTEAKAQCRVDTENTTDDTYLTALIAKARTIWEKLANKRLITSTWDLKFDGFDTLECAVQIPFSPISSVTSIKYLATDGTLTTVSASLYVVDAASMPGRVYPAYAQLWPFTQDIPNSVTIRYVAGYGAAAAVPADIKHGLKLAVAQDYAFREPVTADLAIDEIPSSYKSLLFANRMQWC